MKTRRILITILTISLVFLFAWTAVATPPDDDTETKIVDDVIVLNKLRPDYEYGDLYSPVVFNHQLHSTMFGCRNCHHLFETHKIEGVIVADDGCTAPDCHHMETVDFETPSMTCSVCHPEEGFTEKVRNFACDKCHELEKSFDVRTIELEDGTFYNPPSLQGIYHQNCFECHPAKRKNDAGEEELACDKCHNEDEEE